ncbi:hypothetical protein ACRDNQ_14335 [Palleronia sp. KMU-117]|uniref:hypothetical protein n=1 Tax=Palleronia sp. KMU-117 TaxID=3434108 RepID=UPI003D719BB4
MPTTLSALSSLVPLAGAVALTIQGTRRLFRKPSDPRPARSVVPQPIEVPPPMKAAARPRKERPDGTCPECGTSIPNGERVCAICERKAAATGVTRSLLLHWLVFTVMMVVIFGGGWLLTL